MGILEDTFGEFCEPESGKKTTVKRYTLTSPSGVEVQVISYGAGVSAILVPDKSGKKEHVTLGFDKLEGYEEFSYQGSSVGRHANRINKGKLSIDGQSWQLSINNDANHLHGGKRGWDKYVWESCVVDGSVVFSRLSPDGEEGYPGDVLAQVKYTLNNDGALRIDFEAMTTRATPINMTNHCFFNLAGHDAGQKGIFEHVVKVNADCYTPVTEDLIPTGELAPVGGTGFDLRSPITFGEALPKVPGGGFDHNFCLHHKHRGELEFAARFHHPPTGRVLEVYTTEPGVQIYTGNFLPKEDGKMVGRNGSSYTYQGSVCCEPQNFPNAVNQDNFPNDVTRPGKSYRHSMMYKFIVDREVM
ncbi:galactose mutarotase-like [Homarus americanus]|uniref:galactose mutarotase-like n=1 Tax=Homarus americanus TaxID=6706 RepID=UPI001C48BBE9|nr:galactose mutarotase-like [Homarus americanus]XP_042220852.1 galactose mutarotase-like [Homarus americanus]XP_042220853.1 galactose mutarotase-like [Homarus americanus]XP_042220854.1 galactose mutarotase-like [Homarus americanus]